MLAIGLERTRMQVHERCGKSMQEQAWTSTSAPALPFADRLLSSSSAARRLQRRLDNNELLTRFLTRTVLAFSRRGNSGKTAGQAKCRRDPQKGLPKSLDCWALEHVKMTTLPHSIPRLIDSAEGTSADAGRKNWLLPQIGGSFSWVSCSKSPTIWDLW